MAHRLVSSSWSRSWMGRSLFGVRSHLPRIRLPSVSELLLLPWTPFGSCRSGHKVLPFRSFLCCRFFSSASDEICGNNPAWYPELKQAQSWLELANALQSILTMEEDDRKRFTYAATKRFRELVPLGKAPSDGKAMCRLSNVLLSLVQKDNPQCASLDEEILALLAERAVALLAVGKFSGDDVGGFLKSLVVLCGRQDRQWTQLQPLVDKLVEDEDKQSLNSLVQGIVACSQLRGLSAASLLTLTDRKLRAFTVSCSDEDLVDLLKSCSRLRQRDQLMQTALKRICDRVWQFNRYLLPNVLHALSFSPRHFRNAHTEYFLGAADQCLAEVSEHLSHQSVMKTAFGFHSLQYEAKRFDFRREFLRRIKMLPPSQCFILFKYIIFHIGCDRHVLDAFRVHLKHSVMANRLPAETAIYLLYVLRSPQIFDLGVIKNLVVLVAFAVRRFVQNGELSASMVGHALSGLLGLGCEDQWLYTELLPIGIREVCDMNDKSMGQFAFGVSCLRHSQHYVRPLLGGLAQWHDKHGLPGLTAASVLSKALHRLHVADGKLLAIIGEVAYNSVGENMLDDLALLGPVANIAYDLASLRYLSRQLFDWLHGWLEKNATHVQSALMHSKLMVKLLWALAVHHRYPTNVLKLGWEANIVRTMPQTLLLKLHMLDQLAKAEAGLSPLQPPVLDVVHASVRQRGMESLHHRFSVWLELESLLGKDALRFNVVTSALYRIGGAFFTGADGTVARWPTDCPVQPSAADIQQLIAKGLQPVAVNVYPLQWFIFDSNVLQGRGHVISRCLAACGWKEIVLRASVRAKSFNSSFHLREQLRSVGVQLDT